MESIQKKMLQLKSLKEAAQDKENALTNRLAELNDILKARDDEILQLGKKIMHVENDLDSTTEKLLKANLDIEQAEKDQLAKEEEVSGLQRRVILLDDDITRSESRLSVESKKLEEAAKLADEVERARKILENKGMQNDEKIDSLDANIIIATTVAIDSSRKMEEASRKLAMTQVDLERTLSRCEEAEVEIQELEDELKIVGQNMKTLELSETDALARQEKYEETIRTLSCNLKMTEIQAAHAEREAAKLQKELDAVILELEDWKDKYQEICVELEQTFNEMSGYWEGQNGGTQWTSWDHENLEALEWNDKMWSNRNVSSHRERKISRSIVLFEINIRGFFCSGWDFFLFFLHFVSRRFVVDFDIGWFLKRFQLVFSEPSWFPRKKKNLL